MMRLYQMGLNTLPIITYLVCFILAGFVFYRSKIRKPLILLTASAGRIAENDLDFSIAYDRTDELGLLCKAFEKMRSALESNNREMWWQMNERKKLNAALMLMLFIAIVAFVSAVMVIGLKLVSTIWDDTKVYHDLRRLGMKRNKIKGFITKQMLFVYFIPTVLGCIIGAFTTYRIMLVSGVIYIGKTMQLLGCVYCLVVIIRMTVCFILRSKVMRNYA